MRGAGWVLLGVLAGCGKRTESSAGAGSGSATLPAGRLFTDAELTASSAALLGRLAENEKRVCTRPVIGGAATAGRSTDEIASLVEPGGGLAPCLDRMTGMLNRGDLNDLIVRRDPELLALDRACGEQVTQAILAAGAHLEGCSPYQVGVRVAHGLLPAVSAARLLSVHARLLAANGDPRTALMLLVRGFGVFQDLGRGHVNMLVAMVANGAKTVLLEHAWAITRGALPVPALDDAATAIDTALSAEPPFRDVLEGERDWTQLFMGYALTQPASWTPPGGWDDNVRDRATPPVPRYTRHLQDEAALTLAYTSAATDRYLDACPAERGLAACFRAVAKLTEDNAERASALTDDPTDLLDQLAKLLPQADDDKAREALRVRTRTSMIEMLSVAEAYNPQSTIAQRGVTLARLASLRLHIEVLRFVARTQRCPTVFELDAPPFRALVTPAVLGDQLSIERRGNTIRVTPPAWVGSSYPPWEVPCPR